MLQIVTKMYFRAGVPLHSTVHRAVLYTNLTRLRADRVGLPVGELAWSDGTSPVGTATVSVTEHLEAEEHEGSSVGLVATGGAELVGDLANVLSFGLNAAFSRDGDLVRRLVPGSLGSSNRTGASRLFRRTFEPNRFLTDSELDELRLFIDRLLALERPYFERAMRAIRRIVDATQRAADDPTIAYVDFVAALESLSEGADTPAPEWDQMEARKRKLIEQALADADDELADRVRQAVMEAERLGAARRFVAFVKQNLGPSYYRSDAEDAALPMRSADLERALKLAYQVRSRNVHVLAALPPEAWALGDGVDTVSPVDMGVMFSLEGLRRLARYVVTSYVEKAPVGLDQSFDWRENLPGRLLLRAAPQYWVGQAEHFDRKSASRYFSGFVSHLVGTLAERAPSLPDMTAVLEAIEHLVPGTAEGSEKTAMVAIYALWHRLAAAELHRPDATRFLDRYDELLRPPGDAAFVVGLMCAAVPEWEAEDWHRLSLERRAQRMKRRHLELPPGIDAVLHVVAAESLISADRLADATVIAAYAVEELPGNAELIAWEAAVKAEHDYELDLNALIPGIAEESAEQEPDAAEPGDDVREDRSVNGEPVEPIQ